MANNTQLKVMGWLMLIGASGAYASGWGRAPVLVRNQWNLDEPPELQLGAER
jgi:hypothetical protein